MDFYEIKMNSSSIERSYHWYMIHICSSHSFQDINKKLALVDTNTLFTLHLVHPAVRGFTQRQNRLPGWIISSRFRCIHNINTTLSIRYPWLIEGCDSVSFRCKALMQWQQKVRGGKLTCLSVTHVCTTAILLLVVTRCPISDLSGHTNFGYQIIYVQKVTEMDK